MRSELREVKRYQECSWYVKVWRNRHILAIPFNWLWYMTFGSFIVTDHDTLERERVTGGMLWKLLHGYAHMKMHYYWTHEEVMAEFDKDDNAGQ